MCWNRALLVHHTSSQCVPARRVRTLRIARKHARGEILCRRLEWEQGAVSSRVASLLRSAEAKPMFYRFVRSSGPSPCGTQWRCVASEQPPHTAPAQGAARPPRQPRTGAASDGRGLAHSAQVARAPSMHALLHPMEVCALPPCYLCLCRGTRHPHRAVRRAAPHHPCPYNSPFSTAHTHYPPSAATEP